MAEPVEQAKGRVAGRRCSRCGGDVAFRPGKDALGCKFCEHLEPIVSDAALRVMELDYDAARASVPTGPAAEMCAGGREVECKNCGAQAIVSGQATRCPFCDAAVVVEIPDDRPQILPQSVLPFGIDRKDADAHSRSGWRAAGSLRAI